MVSIYAAPDPLAQHVEIDVADRNPTRAATARGQGSVNSKGDVAGPPRNIEPLFWLYDWALHPYLWYDRIEGGIE